MENETAEERLNRFIQILQFGGTVDDKILTELEKQVEKEREKLKAA